MSYSEHKFEQACMAHQLVHLPMCHLWKIRDSTTGGQPDLEIAWNGHTTKIEFKYLKNDEDLHKKWEDERQLITCVRYEQQTQHCWVIVWRKLNKPLRFETYFYRPTCLLGGKIPEPMKFLSIPEWMSDEKLIAPSLWERGAILFDGIRHDALTALIRQTHV